MKNFILIAIVTITTWSCGEDFLKEEPIGELSSNQILTETNVEKAVLSAYSVLNGQFNEASNAFNSPASNWSFGDVISDDAYKGGGGTGDQNQIHLMEIFATTPTIKDIKLKWSCLYEGISRANQAIRLLNKLESMPTTLKTQRIAEMKFLRGHYHFEAKKIYNNICWVDENVITKEDFYNISNSDLKNEEQWNKIENDFKEAYSHLPATQDQLGRPTKMAAKAYLLKCYIFQKKWQEAITAANEVINSQKYTLEDSFEQVFLPKNDNGKEIIFAVQHSINDGSPRNYNGSIGDRLMPPGGPYPGYGFLRPTQNLVNAFKTNTKGLPVSNPKDITKSDFVDPRVDHSLARPGIPYLDLGIYNWTPREASVYGPYSPKKRMISKNSPYILSAWPYVTVLNYYVIRYADVLLWKAEAEIEGGSLEEGRKYINAVRKRTKNSNYVKTLKGNQDAANYKIEIYSTSFNNKQEAREALQIERRLEFAHEGHRFFDLVRWGIAAEVMNNYFKREIQIRSHLVNAQFIEGKNEYQPIPQSQMDLSQGDMVQNPGY